MKAIERIKEYIDYKGFNNSQFEKLIDLSNGYIGTQLKRKADIGENVFNKILDNCLDVDPVWLLTGYGNMLKSDKTSEVLPTIEKESHLIPLYDTIATAGKSTVDMAPVLLPSEYIDAGDWFRDATAAMRVHGDSMYPEYHSGSIVAIKEVSKGLIVYGEDYVFETDDYRMLKRLQRGQDKHHVLVASANTEKWDDGSDRGRLVHEPFDIHLDEIKRLFIVLGSVRRVHTSRIVYNHKSSK
ncbi:S24 family peptidase [Sphingobacterium multivorum]